MQIIQGMIVLGIGALTILCCTKREVRQRLWIRVSVYSHARACALDHLDKTESHLLKQWVNQA